MITNLNKDDLINFEKEVAQNFNEAKIKAPVHLYSSNEDVMLDIFKNVKSNDWIFCSWRSHYQCLLKGVPRDLLMKEILEGKSISLCFPKYNIYSSAIVGGSIPIALGRALACKFTNEASHVYCFIGDMTSESGIAHEVIKYSTNHELPITFIIEDNTKSVMTDTKKVWAQKELTYEKSKSPNIIYYKYNLTYPHAGAGKRVQF